MDHLHPTTNGGSGQPVGAAAAAQQPKVVQTAFIHKLYKLVHSATHAISNMANNLKHARGSKHSAPDIVVSIKRELRYVSFV
jgi:hypothetical protein